VGRCVFAADGFSAPHRYATTREYFPSVRSGGGLLPLLLPNPLGRDKTRRHSGVVLSAFTPENADLNGMGWH
jgi:hypothetical protein